MFTDDELYGQYLAGDVAAFDELILKYTGRLVLYLNGLTHNMQDAEDFAIETFAAIPTPESAIRGLDLAILEKISLKAIFEKGKKQPCGRNPAWSFFALPDPFFVNIAERKRCIAHRLYY